MKNLLLALALVAFMSSYASATVVDLTVEDSGTINGAQFIFSKEQPAGSGVLQPFLSIRDRGIEEGYNTDAPSNALPLDGIRPHFTYSLPFSSLVRDADGYFQFVLDINENNNRPNNLLSLDGLKFYVTNLPAQNGNTVVGSLIWNMDAIEESHVLLDVNREGMPGSGATDMLLRINLPDQASDAYLIMWSEFGRQGGGAAAGDGYEEWAAQVGEGFPEPIPEPGTILLLGAGLAGLALYHRRQGNK